MHQCIPRALVVLTLLGVLCSAVPAWAQAWLDSAWTFRSPIMVTNTNGSTLANFQVAVVLDSTFNFAGAKPDGSDLRATGADGTTTIPFWIETWSPTIRQAKVWVRVPSLPAGGTTIYLYYGQPLATSVANGKNTFEMFDDFTSPASDGYYHLGPASTIMTQDTPWEYEAPHTLSVVTAPTGAPWTYYGYYGLQGCSGIGIAGSNDLRNWTKFPSNPLFAGGGERWPHVLQQGSTYFMVHTINFCGTTSIVYRTSTNGTSWSGPTQMVAPQAGQRNQNPNLFQDPKTGLFHLFWYRGNDATLWTIMGRTASTLSGLATASNQVLISSNQTLAAPNMMFRDSTYFLSTEISEGVWKTVVFSAPSPTGPFTRLPGNPLMGDGSACLFQFPLGSSIYQYYCKETDAVWTLDMRVTDTGLGRQQIGVLDSTQWTTEGGDWHPLVATQPNGQQGMVGQGSTNDEQALKTSYSATNYMLESAGRLIEGRTFGIGARGTDAENGYRLNLYEDLDGEPNLFLYRLVNGFGTELWSAAVGTVDKDTWYTLGLRVNDSQLRVYFNDVLQTPAPIVDTQFDTGPALLTGESTSLAQFDDVRVRKNADIEPTSVRGPEEVLGNSRPVAAISAPANNSSYTAANVTLTSGSTDAQDPPDSLLYRWDVERHRDADPAVLTTFITRDTAFTPVLGADSAVVYYRVRLKVTDLGGLTDSTAVTIYPEIDLAPSAITIVPSAPTSADSLTLSVMLRNLGRVHTPLTHWTLRDGPALLAEGDAAIAALDSVLVSRTIAPIATGDHTLRFTADTLGVAYETSEANNASTRTLHVDNAPGVNQPPVANAAAAPSTGAAPLTVNFSSLGSSDPDGDSLSYAWSFGNGDSSAQANPSHLYTGSGVFAAVLTVDDARGGIARDTVIVTVAGASGFPTAGILDDFNRPDGPLGAPWIDTNHGLGSMTIADSALVQICCQYSSPVWNGAVFGPDQEAYITFTAMTATAPEHDLMLKLQGTGDDAAHIEVRFNKNFPHVAVGTYDPNTGWGTPAPPIAADFDAGDQLGARAKSDGIVEVYKNGLLIGTVDCSAWAYATQGGRIGLTLDQAYSSRLDNFGGGNVVVYSPPVIASTSPRPAAQVGVAYADTLAASGGAPPYTWSVSAGALPTGLALGASTGIISGTPITPGAVNFTIQVTDTTTGTATRPFDLTVVPAALVITSSAPLPAAQVGIGYAHTLTASGGTPPLVWEIAAGDLPSGLNLDASSGAITGMPFAPGTSNFRVRLTDAASVRDSAELSLVVHPPGEAPVAWWPFEEGGGTSIVDHSGWANHGTTQGASFWTSGLSGLGLSLEGGPDRVLVPDATSLDPTTAITMATWIRPAQVANQVLMSKAIESATSGYELGLSSDGHPFARFNQAVSGDTFRVDATASYPSNGADWMHVAATYDGAEIRLYVNGLLDTLTTASFSIATNNLALALGAQGDGARAYRGALDEARLYTRALSSSEIAAIAALPPVTVDSDRAPAITELAGARPNPFRATTTLEFALSQAGPAELAIYDLNGRRVRSLQGGSHPAGIHRVTWNGRDDAGNRVGPGIYFARLETRNGGYSKRVVRLN